MINAKCKICRRNQRKLFLKGEKCFSPKCPMIQKAYAPGMAAKKRRRPLSEYGKELSEKQKLRNWYGLRERQFRKYVDQVLDKSRMLEDVNPAEILIRSLETRLDNVVFRLGFSINRKHGRQLVNHGFFLLNGKNVDIPSMKVKLGDKISFRENSKVKVPFTQLAEKLKTYEPPVWLKLDKKDVEGEIIGLPTLKEVSPPAEISSIFEFYSR